MDILGIMNKILGIVVCNSIKIVALIEFILVVTLITRLATSKAAFDMDGGQIGILVAMIVVGLVYAVMSSKIDEFRLDNYGC